MKMKKGAASELIVSADLLRRGWQVYRNLAHAGCPDLIAYDPRNGRLVRIEVKTRTPANSYNPYARVTQKEHLDVLAIVEGGAVEYLPPDLSDFIELPIGNS